MASYAQFMLAKDLADERRGIQNKLRLIKKRMERKKNRAALGRLLGTTLALAFAPATLAGMGIAGGLSLLGSKLGEISDLKKVGKVSGGKFFSQTRRDINAGVGDFRRGMTQSALLNAGTDALMLAMVKNMKLKDLVGNKLSKGINLDFNIASTVKGSNAERAFYDKLTAGTNMADVISNNYIGETKDTLLMGYHK